MADMKTPREALAVLADTANEAPLRVRMERMPTAATHALLAALDELEALRSERELSLASVVEAQRDELLAALRRLYDEGEGCAACGKATVPGCGCRYEQAAQALAKAGGQ